MTEGMESGSRQRDSRPGSRERDRNPIRESRNEQDSVRHSFRKANRQTNEIYRCSVEAEATVCRNSDS